MNPKSSPRASPPSLCVTPTEAAHQLRIGRTKMYALLHQRVIPSVRLGRKILIPTQALTDWLQQQASDSSKSEEGDANG